MQNSLSLSAQNGVALTQNDVISTKELAEQLNTTKDVILANAKKCLPNKIIEHGKATFWNKAEVTVILDYMKNHTSNNRSVELNSTVANTTTDLTPALKIKKAMELMQEGYEEELAILRAKNAELQPSATSWETYAGNMEHRNSEKSFREVAKLLNLNPQNCLTNWCEKNGFIYRNKGVYTASQKAITKGILVNRIVNAENGWSGEQCKITAYGMRFFSEMKAQGEFGYCVLTDKPEDGSNRPARPSRDYRKRGDK